VIGACEGEIEVLHCNLWRRAENVTNSPTRRALLGKGAGLALIGAAGASRAQSRTIELISYLTAPAPVVQSVRLFADKVAEQAAGALVVDIEHRMGLSMPVMVLGQVSPLSYFLSIQGREANPLFVLSSLPMLASSFDEAQILLDVARPYYATAFARFDLVLLAADPWRPPALWSHKPVQSARDLKGSTFDLMNMAHTARWGLVFDRLGVRYSPFSAEIMLSWGHGVNTFRFEPVFQFFTEIFLASQLNFLTVSRTFLSALPLAQREALGEAARLAEAQWWQAARELVVHDQKEIASLGCTVTGVPPAELVSALRAAAEPDIERWANSVGSDGHALLARYRRAIGQT
jgi:TRAP-type C4-dicarboxylate transport system substrate-binding protein